MRLDASIGREMYAFRKGDIERIMEKFGIWRG